jgi:hypothetical protein
MNKRLILRDAPCKNRKPVNCQKLKASPHPIDVNTNKNCPIIKAFFAPMRCNLPAGLHNFLELT